MRKLVTRGLVALRTFVQSNQSTSSTCPTVASNGVKRCLSTNPATSSAAAGRAGRSDAEGELEGSIWSPYSAVMFMPSLVCGCLAYWQYERMKWKEELIEQRRGIAKAEPRDVFLGDGPLYEYDKVQVRGRFLHEYSLFVGPRPRSIPGAGIQQGYFVITPMLSADRKGVVLVNRGWVPTAWKEAAEAEAAAKVRAAAAEAEDKKMATAETDTTATATAVTTAGRSWWSWLGSSSSHQLQNLSRESRPQSSQQPAVKAVPEPEMVVGVIQYDEQPSNFMPDNKPEKEEFHFIQRVPMTQVLGLSPDTPLIMAISTDPSAVQAVQKRSPLEEARSAAGTTSAPSYPAPKHVDDLLRFSTMPGDHRNYALIWATLCVTLAFMGRTAVTKPLRGPRIVEEQGRSARDAWKASQAN